MEKTPETKKIKLKAPREPKTKRSRRVRCAETGEFVTAGYAEANPKTTTAEEVAPMSLGDTCQFGVPTVSIRNKDSDGR